MFTDRIGQMFQPMLEEDGGGGTGELEGANKAFMEQLIGLSPNVKDEPDEPDEPDDDDEPDEPDEPDANNDDDDGPDEPDEPGKEPDEPDEPDKDPKKKKGEPGKKGEPDAKSKQNKVFAELRVQNKQLKNMIDSLAAASKIDKDLPLEDKMKAITDSMVEVQAKQTGIPKEFLEMFNQMKEGYDSNEEQKLQFYNEKSFSEVQDKYSLTDEELESFQNELIESDNDFREEEIDIEYAYVDLHKEDIIEKMVNERFEKEMKRKEKVEVSSTNPGTKKGTKKGEGNAEGKKINDVKGLEEFMAKTLKETQ